jgi:hypothetical protein
MSNLNVQTAPIAIEKDSRAHLTNNPARIRFGKRLKELRREKGYASAYAFYFRNGGESRFPFSYPHYLQIEKGTRLPSVKGIKTVASILLEGSDSPRRSEVLSTYVQAMLGGDPFFETLFGESTLNLASK